jgi:membrane associated rhomboid family serine protease
MGPPGRAATRPAFPVLTTAVAAVTAAVSVAGLVAEPVLVALRRDAVALSDGQLWRLLTALLVQDGGVPGTVFNLLGLVLVGVAAERRLGARAWLAAYLVGGLTGELVGWAGWQPVGGGNSVGVCGLAGALAVVVLRDTRPPGRLETVAPATWATALTASTLTGFAPAAAAVTTGLAAAAAPRVARALPAALVAVSAGLLLFQHDIHGSALGAGLLAGIAIAARREPAG